MTEAELHIFLSFHGLLTPR